MLGTTHGLVEYTLYRLLNEEEEMVLVQREEGGGCTFLHRVDIGSFVVSTVPTSAGMASSSIIVIIIMSSLFSI